MTTTWPIHGRIDGPIVMIGFGSIGKGTLPLIERHFEFDKQPLRRHRSRRQGPRAPRRARRPLRPGGGDARQLPRAADAAARPQAAGRASASTSRSTPRRSTSWSSAARSARSTSTPSSSRGRASTSTAAHGPGGAHQLRAARDGARGAKRASPGGPTAVSCCGANPGMVSWFVKQALLDLAARPRRSTSAEPRRRARAGRGSCSDVGVKGIHIAERDTQRAKHPKPMDVFVNTWSVEGFVSEGCSRPSSAGARTRSGCRRTAGARRSAATAGDLPAAAGRQHARALLVPDAGAAVRLPRHPQRVDLDRRLLHAARGRQGRATGRPATTPTIPCNDAVLSLHEMFGRAGKMQDDAPHPRRGRDRRRHRRARRAALRPRARTPTGTARSSRSRRRASSRPTRTRPACR